jgi:hypothetical protein
MRAIDRKLKAKSKKFKVQSSKKGTHSLPLSRGENARLRAANE